MDGKMRCENCKYWISNEDAEIFSPETGQGRCHRNAPIQSNDNRHEWPPTMKNEWCGEWRNNGISTNKN